MFISGVAAPHAATHEPDGSDVLYASGADVDNFHEVSSTDISGSYIKKKETLLVKVPARSTLTISYEARRASGSANSLTRVYKNGAAVGTAHTNNTTTYVKFSEDLDEWDTGDLLQVYMAHSTGSGATGSYVKNLKALFKSAVHGVAPINQDP